VKGLPWEPVPVQAGVSMRSRVRLPDERGPVSGVVRGEEKETEKERE